MIAVVVAAATNAAVAKQAAAPGTEPGALPFNWFDIAVAAILLFGFFRGRHNGMSKEILPLLQWIVIVVGCGLGYPIAAQFFTNTLKMDKLMSVVLGYIALAIVVFIVFTILKKLFASRLDKGDSFKGGEYYLGMLAGILRYACIILVALALLNAPVYTEAWIAAHKQEMNQTYGAGLPQFSGDLLPDLQQVQEQVFAKSYLGPRIKDNLGRILIVGDAPASSAPAQPGKPGQPGQPGQQQQPQQQQQPKPTPKITIG